MFQDEENKIEVTLTVYDVSALKLLVATDTVAVLTKYNICSAEHHFVCEIIESRRGITAILLTAVVNTDKVVAIFLCFSYILLIKLKETLHFQNVFLI